MYERHGMLSRECIIQCQEHQQEVAITLPGSEATGTQLKMTETYSLHLSITLRFLHHDIIRAATNMVLVNQIEMMGN